MQIKNFIYHDKINYKNNNFLKKILDNFDSKNPTRDNNWNCLVETSHSSKNKPNVPKRLINEINCVLKKFGNRLNNKFFNTLSVHSQKEIWYNVYTKNMYQEKHAHGKFLFSGVYFFKFNKEVHSAPIFYNNFFDSDFHSYQFNDVDLFFYQPTVEEGDIVIFPSNMFHEVKPQTTDETRITIAFNASCNDYVFEKEKTYLTVKYD